LPLLLGLQGPSFHFPNIEYRKLEFALFLDIMDLITWSWKADGHGAAAASNGYSNNAAWLSFEHKSGFQQLTTPQKQLLYQRFLSFYNNIFNHIASTATNSGKTAALLGKDPREAWKKFYRRHPIYSEAFRNGFLAEKKRLELLRIEQLEARLRAVQKDRDVLQSSIRQEKEEKQQLQDSLRALQQDKDERYEVLEARLRAVQQQQTQAPEPRTTPPTLRVPAVPMKKKKAQPTSGVRRSARLNK
jgi:hypothetical protein